MRAVLDPNVLVSALLSPLGPPGRIVSDWIEGRFELVVSPDLLSELAEVLARPKFRRWITHQAGAEFVAGLAVDAHVVDDPPAEPSLSPDPDDDYLLALARAANADYLVSGDNDLISLADPDPPVLAPRAFLDRVDRL